jgi:polyphosphate kinase
MESDTTAPATMGHALPDSFSGRLQAMNRRIPTPAQFLNRELGLLAFNRRVLAQAADDTVPLLERLRFITIVSSNLDEFFEIRVAGLKETIKLGLAEAGPDGRSAADVFAEVSREAHALVAEQYQLLNQTVLPALEREGVVFPRREQWDAAQKQWIRRSASIPRTPSRASSTRA